MAGGRYKVATRTPAGDERAASRPAAPAAPTGTTDTAALGPQAVLRLQAAAGNRSTTRLLAAGGGAAAIQATTVQRRRQPEQVEQSKLETYVARREPGEGESGDEHEAMRANYDKSLAAGQRLRAQGLKWFGGEPDAVRPVSTPTTTAAIEEAGYKTFWFHKGNTVTVNTVRGRAFDRYQPGQVAGYDLGGGEDDQDYFYSNSFDTSTGTFHASVNFKNADQAVADKERLSPPVSNSEMIWYQQDVARRAVGDEAATLRSIEREQISNTQTLDTIFLTDRGDEVQQEEEEEWVELDDPTLDDVWALLGTPNGNSAVWVLMQHGAQAGLTDIESVAYTKDGLRITYM